jgi:hypothetical protein
MTLLTLLVFKAMLVLALLATTWDRQQQAE